MAGATSTGWSSPEPDEGPRAGSIRQRHVGLQLRIACNGRRRNTETGQWEDQPNYFDVTVWGAQGENCQRYLTKGRPVAIDGRLRWREWTSHGGAEAPGGRYHR